MYRLEFVLIGEGLDKYIEKIKNILTLNRELNQIIDKKLLQIGVIHFYNSKLAIEYTQKHYSDVIVCRKIMPYVDGIGVVHALKKDVYNPFIIGVGATMSLDELYDRTYTLPFINDFYEYLILQAKIIIEFKKTKALFLVDFFLDYFMIQARQRSFFRDCIIALVEKRHLQDPEPDIYLYLKKRTGKSRSTIYKRFKSIADVTGYKITNRRILNDFVNVAEEYIREVNYIE